MPCPTCSHTLATLGICNERKIQYCDRCGTVVVSEKGVVFDVYRPSLVDRCRLLLPALENHHQNGIMSFPFLKKTWHALGLAESINVPEDRPEIKP